AQWPAPAGKSRAAQRRLVFGAAGNRSVCRGDVCRWGRAQEPVNQITRRAFVQSAVVSAVALGAGPILAESPRRKIKVGFLGGAHPHGLAKWKIVNASPDFELLGIAEESAEVRSQYERLGAK